MNISFLCTTALFRGTSREEAEAMLGCMGAFTRQYRRQEMIYRAGEEVRCLGVVLSGGANIEADDVWGNRSILSHVAAGQIFAETYACIPGQPLLVSVTATEETEVLFLNTAKLLQTCTSAYTHHSRLIQNLLQISARKNLALSQRMFHTAPKTIRGRLLSYFSQQAMEAGEYQFSIPFNRQQLADYLGVDRSAMSNELSKMQQEGLIRYQKNVFELKKPLEDVE